MAKIWLDHSDGRYSTRPLTDEEAAESESRGGDVVHLEDNVWESYLRHCDRDATWQMLWRSISNEQYMRRRAQELMPLEDAEREIRRLKDDLAQAQRMWRFFEGEDARRRQEQHREEHVEYTCIYPQPGCQVDALKNVPGMHPEWIEAAENIMEQSQFAERAAEGLKYQGCCCGHKHLLLGDADAEMLRGAGFVVENDTEAV